MRSLQVLILVAMAFAIGLSGPVAKSFALTPAKLHEIALAERAVETAHAGGTIDLKVASAKPCERPLVAWTKCSIDNGFLPAAKPAIYPDMGEPSDTVFTAAVFDIRENRIFRPPRLG